MDNNHHNHVFDPALTHSALDDKQKQLAQVLSVNPSDASTSGSSSNSGTAAGQLQADGTPVKRRPGRPKGSTKKNLLGNESAVPLKIKRPVGRPRKDGFPAGSVVSRIKREKTAGLPQGVPMVQYGAPMPGLGYPPIAFGYAPLPPPGIPPPPPMFPLDPSLAAPEGDDWAELARTNSNAFLSTLLAALAAPNPIAHAGQSVEDAFKSLLGSLHAKATNNAMYNMLRTFWMPCSPAFFALTASGSTARWPEYRFLLWDPQALAFNGIACPNCSTPLINKGRITSGPIKIYDLEKPFFIIGCEYVCQSAMCIAAVSSPEGRKFASTDQSILRSLPVLLKGEFPARLLNGNADAGSGPNVWNWRAMGVSTNLWNLVMSALKCGLRKEVILRMIWAVQNKVPEFPMENSGAPGAGQQQSQQSGEDHQQDKMDDEDDDNEADGDDHELDGGADHPMASGSSQPQPQSQSQTLSSSASFPEAFNSAWPANSSMTDSTSMSNTHMKGPATPVPTVPSQVQSPLRMPATPTRSVAAGVTSPPPHPSTPSLPTVPSSASPQRHEHPQQPPLRLHSQAQSRPQEPQTPAPAPTSAPPEAQPQPSAQQTEQPPPPPVGAGYSPYSAYPFTPYAYHFVNGALVPANLNLVPSSSMSLPMSAFPSSHPPTSTSGSGSTSSPGPGPMVASSSSSSHSHLPMSVVPSHLPLGPGVPVPPPPQGGTPISGTKRSPRHCVKCGSQDCKGKGGRSFCTNGCQDCGKIECKGRNSRRPDKKCSEGWT